MDKDNLEQLKENKLEKLKQRRTTIRGLTTRLINKCEQSVSEQNDDPVIIADYLEQFNAKHETLKDLDCQIQDLMEHTSDFENEIETCESYYEKIISIKSKLKTFAKPIDRIISSSSNSDNNGRVNSAANDSNLASRANCVDKSLGIKLPKLSINKFDGDSSNWLSFWSQYENAIHKNDDLSNVDKFNYLHSLVSGAPANAISGFSLTNENYAKAIELLKQRFGRNDLVINAHISKLLNLEPVKNPNNTFALRKLYDNIEIQVRNLSSLNVTSGTYGTLLTPILLKLLPNELNLEFNRKRKSKEKFDVDELLEFLREEIECREISNQIQDKIHAQHSLNYSKEKRQFKNPIPTAATLAAGSERFGVQQSKQIEKKLSCVFCGKSHGSTDCSFALTLSPEQRKQSLIKKGACFRCLKLNHVASQCRLKIRCSNCYRCHHFLLCPNIVKKDFRAEEKPECFANQDETLASVTATPSVLLQTLDVTIRNGDHTRNARAIIDSASQRSYILNSTARKLNYEPLRKENLRHSLFGGTSTDVCEHDVYKIYLANVSGTYRCNFEVLGQEIICETMPPVTQGNWMKELLENDVVLSDHHRQIEVLIGADVAGKLMTGNYKKLPSGLAAIETKLGWTVMGRTKREHIGKNTDLIVTSMLSKDICVPDLWDLDTLGIRDPAEKHTKEEQEKTANEYFLRTLKRLPDGRYEVSLPWVEGHQTLLNNRLVSERRLGSTIKALKGKDLLKYYGKVLDEWQAEGVIEEVDISKLEDPNCFYLPHRAVIKEHSTTKIRPVFDASAKQKNCPSLNDCLEKGPNLMEQIPSVLNRFRLGKFGVVADIKKAFLQISISEKDRDFLRFLWHADGNSEYLKIYRHARVVFGVNASPFLLSATISYHLQHVPEHQQEISKKLRNSFYVDNCVTSFNTEEEMKQFIEQSKQIMADAKFDLRGWRHNETRYSTSEKMDIDYHTSKNNEMNFQDSDSVPVLGLEWNVFEDTLCCTPKDNNLTFGVAVTKRTILSFANQLFDPLGFLSPVTLILKVLVQDCWKAKFSWDDELPDEISKKFLKWRKDVIRVQEVKISRRLLFSHKGKNELSFHVFCDASQQAYATCVYLRNENASGVFCRLVQARSRVAPLKPITISRLELLACTIGVRLLKTIKEDLQLGDIPSFYWTDSMNALHWIRNEEQWGVFVMNRVQEIRRCSNPHEWNHVPGVLNPADLPSRGCSLQTLISKKWHEGPLWLKQEQGSWPSTEISPDKEIVNSEKRKTIVSSLTTSAEEFSYFTRISSFEKIVRITAWIRRFINNCKIIKAARKTGNLNIEELKHAEISIWKIVQKNTFKSADCDRLRHLKPFTDSSGIIRVKSQLLMRQDFENFKFPIILPSDHEIVTKLIMHKHKLLLHCGIQTLMAELRENFWILRSRRTIRKVLRRCILCKRYDARHPEVQAAPLPEDRIKDSAVFEVTGIDLAGPLFLRDGSKAWVVLFTCAIYRAVHLELVSSLSTERFLLALRRFISRRGRPSIIYTDNGSNFVGANLALKNLDWDKIIRDTSVTRIKWKFIPPGSPWWGGFWERMIGLMKNILRKVLGKASLKYEEVYTILCDCENTINLRPLTYISDDSELEPLTPAMFLRDIKESGVIDVDHIDAASLNKRLLYRMKILEDLRKRFRSEYLGQLKSYTRKLKNYYQFSVGDVVLIESNTKRLKWPLAKIIELFPGKDGIVRLVKLRTKSGDILRPIQRLIPLEVTSPKDENLRKGLDGSEKSDKEKHDEVPETINSPISAELERTPDVPKTSRYGRKIRTPQVLDL